MSATTPTKTDIFGVCTAVGRDVGFHPDILRVAFAVGLFLNAPIAIGLYAMLGLIVLASRWLFPEPRKAATVTPLPAAPARPATPLFELREAA